jgi:hypothetical protein
MVAVEVYFKGWGKLFLVRQVNRTKSVTLSIFWWYNMSSSRGIS